MTEMYLNTKYITEIYLNIFINIFKYNDILTLHVYTKVAAIIDN